MSIYESELCLLDDPFRFDPQELVEELFNNIVRQFLSMTIVVFASDNVASYEKRRH